MNPKQKKIFLITFILTILISIGLFFWFNRIKEGTQQDEKTEWYQKFNPFNAGGKISNIIDNIVDTDNKDGTSETKPVSKFYQITDFAIAGATFVTDLKQSEEPKDPEMIKVFIDPNTKEGRVRIQEEINKTEGIKSKIIENGIFDQATVLAIKEFQKIKQIPVTGKIDEKTKTFFTELKAKPYEPKMEPEPSVRYVERLNGHIYKMVLESKEKTKISNTIIPAIYEAIFNKTGTTVIYRYLTENENIASFMASLGGILGEYLPTNIQDISISPLKNNIFYLVEKDNVVNGFVKDMENGSTKTIFSHPFTEWVSDWSNENVYLTTKASSYVTGSTYILNQENQTINKIIGGVVGLTSRISRDGSKLVFSESTKGGPKLYLYDIKNNTTTDLKLYGIAEKCVWGRDSINLYCALPTKIDTLNLPDKWYQGATTFEDIFVKIDVQKINITNIADSTKENPIDAFNLFVDDNEKYLFFTNKKDLTFWMLSLE